MLRKKTQILIRSVAFNKKFSFLIMFAAVGQLMSSLHDIQKNIAPIVVADNQTSTVTTKQGNQGSSGDRNTNTWINRRGDTTNNTQRIEIHQGRQSVVGNGNTNTWNN